MAFMNPRNIFLIGLAVSVLLGLLVVMNPTGRSGDTVPMTYSEFMAQVDSGQIKSATIEGTRVTTQIGDKK
jgi:ATP-dependent Zn protease